MAAIPFSLIDIMAFMAEGGIVVRSLINPDSLHCIPDQPWLGFVKEAVGTGVLRFRPILPTALTVVESASAILADPMFQDLAIALMSGEIGSLVISRMALPVPYPWLLSNRGTRQERTRFVTK